jgi:hypothetical protein
MDETRIVFLLTLLSLAANLALAAGGDDQGQNNQSQSHQWHDHDNWHDQRSVSTPEIDPGQAMAALILLGGAVGVIRGFRRKR